MPPPLPATCGPLLCFYFYVSREDAIGFSSSSSATSRVCHQQRQLFPNAKQRLKVIRPLLFFQRPPLASLQSPNLSQSELRSQSAHISGSECPRTSNSSETVAVSHT